MTWDVKYWIPLNRNAWEGFGNDYTYITHLTLSSQKIERSLIDPSIFNHWNQSSDWDTKFPPNLRTQDSYALWIPYTFTGLRTHFLPCTMCVILPAVVKFCLLIVGQFVNGAVKLRCQQPTHTVETRYKNTIGSQNHILIGGVFLM